MKIGMSGRVSSTVSPEIQSLHHMTARRIGVASTVCTSCGKIPGEVGLERFEAAAGRDGEACGAATGEPLRPERSDRIEESFAQFGLHPRRGAGRDALLRPQQHRAPCDDSREGGEDREELGLRHPVDRPHDRARQQPRERDDHERLREPDRGDRDEESAR